MRSHLRRFDRSALVGMLLLFAFGAATPRVTADEDQFEPIRAAINKGLTESNLPSIAVAVARDGKIIWEQGFGLADRENRTPATEHTLYSVASVSKPLTATGLMVLVQRGKIDLDKPLDDYLGEAKLKARIGNAADATVRRVANHTSGLPLHYQFFYDDESFHPPARDETIRRYANLVTPPGEQFQYSNLGYGLLDFVIERVGEKKYADFMREEIFLPLGMTHTSVDVGPGLEPHQAIRYTPGGKRIPFYTFDHPGASAVYSSAHDLVRFAMFHMKEHLLDQRQILSDETIDAMQVSPGNEAGGYAIGWGKFKNARGYECVQHTGGMPGVSTTVRFVPSRRLAVVVLANSRSPLAYRLPDMIVDLLLPEQESEKKAATTNESAEAKEEPKKEEPNKEEPKAEESDQQPAKLKDLAGNWRGEIVTYQGSTPLRLTVKETGDVHVRLGDQLVTLLSNASFRNGILRGQFAGKVPYDDNRGRDYLIQLELKRRDDKLTGAASTITQPDAWGNNAVTHWAELKK
jgi:CubicO group peptidase (beta-lactamase class C family)